jgi:hypothetical protein
MIVKPNPEMAHREIAVTTELVRRNLKMVVILCKVISV